MSDLAYYNNPEEWGDYQFIPIEDIVNNYLMSRSSDDYTSTEPRHKIVYHAKRGLKELYFDVLRQIRAIELAVSPTLNVTIPPDYINYVRISYVDNKGQLHPMSIDKRYSMANRYLQDNNYDLLFDSDGNILQDYGNPATGNNISDNISSDSECGCSQKCFSFAPNRDNSNVYPNGKFNIDISNGIIQFSPDVVTKNIVLEYISDGLYLEDGQSERDIKIHKFAETALHNYIFYELIKNRRTVPAVEKQRAKREYGNSKRIAKRRINTVRADEFRQAFKSSNKWIK